MSFVKLLYRLVTVGIPQVSGIETDVASLSTKKLDECKEYDITIIPRLVGRTFLNGTQKFKNWMFMICQQIPGRQCLGGRA